MTQETLKRANELQRLIHGVQKDIEAFSTLEIGDGKFISIGNLCNIYAPAELLQQVAEMVRDWKLQKIEEWTKELEDL